MSHEVETMVSAREVPWHGLGTVLPNVFTAEEGIVAGGLDWTVEKQEIFRKRGDLYVPVPNRFALVRDVDDKELSIVSDVYRPFQNRQAFSFMDNLVDSGDAKYETAGSLRGGRVIFISMEVPQHIQVEGGDEIKMYLLLRTTHDGSGRISAYVVMVRVVCMNTLTWAIAGAKHKWGVTHTADVEGKVSEARDALGMSFKYSEKFVEQANTLVDVQVTDDDIVALLEGTLANKPRRDDTIESIMENYRGSDTVGDYRGTGWGFINGLTEWQEHVKKNESAEALFTRTLDGENFKIRDAIKSKLLARA